MSFVGTSSVTWILWCGWWVAGAAVVAASESFGITRGRGYEILRALRRGTGKRVVITDAVREQVIAAFGPGPAEGLEAGLGSRTAGTGRVGPGEQLSPEQICNNIYLDRSYSAQNSRT